MIDLPPIKHQYYAISNLGRVSALTNEGRKAKLKKLPLVDCQYIGRQMETEYSGHSSVYSICRLTSTNGKRPYYRVDKLVLLHFHNPEFSPEVRKMLLNQEIKVVFKDGNKKNPSLANLTWVHPANFQKTAVKPVETIETTSTAIKPHPAKGINLKKPIDFGSGSCRFNHGR